MINHLEIDNQSMDHMMEDKAEQQQLTMTLSLLGSSDVAKNQKQQEMNATQIKRRTLSAFRHPSRKMGWKNKWYNFIDNRGYNNADVCSKSCWR